MGEERRSVPVGTHPEQNQIETRQCRGPECISQCLRILFRCLFGLRLFGRYSMHVGFQKAQRTDKRFDGHSVIAVFRI